MKTQFSFFKPWAILTGISFLFLGLSFSEAKEFPYSSTPLQGSDITSGKVMPGVVDTDFATWYTSATSSGSLDPNWARFVNHQYMKGSVTFRIKGETVGGPKLSSLINETIKVDITGFQWVNGQKVSFSRLGTSLGILYGPTGPNGSNFSTQHYARIDIDNVVELYVTVAQGLATAANAPFVELASEIKSARIHEITRGTQGMLAMVKIDDASVDARNLLNVSWTSQDAAEGYDLEWIHIDGDNVTDGTFSTRTSDPLVAVANNSNDPSKVMVTEEMFKASTRVTVKGTSYNLPLVYEQGWIVFRVRAVGFMAVNPSLGTYGAWSTDGLLPKKLVEFDVKNKFYVSKDHQERLNWQYSVNYAEEGKNKLVISYHDGTMRNRQSATKLNSSNSGVDGEAIAGETVYDYEGRGAVNILPVPTGDASLNYKAKLNPNSSNLPYNRDNFDTKRTDACNPAPDPLPTTGSGASNYYSPANQNQTGANAYIPDAQQYPLTQVEYTPDNTGRVKRQSGVGKDHQLGSGHETKYFYGTPNSQEELDRLFGSDAGYVTHYKKNVTVDPNGQVTVTYLDMENRVVATSLAGNGPATVDKLSSQGAVPIASTLFDFNNLDTNTRFVTTDVPNKKSTLDKDLLITSDANYSFNYSIVPEALFTNCTGVFPDAATSSTACYNCVVEATILVTDACSNHYLMDLDTDINNGDHTTILNNQILTNLRNGTYQPTSTASAASFNTQSDRSGYNTPLPFKVGEYTLTRVLKVNQEALDYYLALYLKSPCVRKYEGFLADEQKKVDTTGCNVGCDNCLAKLGAYSQYDPVKTNNACSPCYTYDEYKKMQDLCTTSCDQHDLTCDAALGQMLGDVTLGGQYGEVFKDVLRCSEEQFNELTQKYDCIKTYTDKVVDPSIFQLSLFNLSNLLPSNKAGNANWKNPKHLTNSDFGFYYEEDGVTKSTVVVASDPFTHAYQPALAPGVVPMPYVDENGAIVEGLGLVYPQQLANLTDFLLKWKKSWANSLVTYHPEYASYSLCQTLQASRDFDAKLQQLLYDNAHPGDQTFINTFLSNIAATDPFFKLTGFSQEKAQLTKLLADYGPQSDDPNAKHLSMYQYAYVISVCPSFNGNKCTNNCIPVAANDYSSLTFDIWNNFFALYRGAKTRIYDAWMTRQEITDKSSYNGCIGNKNWSPMFDNFIHYNYSVAHNQTISFNLCLPFVAGWGLNLPDGIRACGWIPARNYYTFRSQYYNVDQPCFQPVAGYYASKQKVFMRANDMEADPSVQGGSTCFATPSLDPTTITTYDNSVYAQSLAQTQACSAWTQKTTNATQTLGKMTYLQECKQCPVSKSISDLCTAMIPKHGFVPGNSTQLSCYPQGVGQFDGLLESQLGLGDEVTKSLIYWQCQALNVTPTYTELVVKIGPLTPLTGGNPTLHLFLPQPYTFSQLQSLCCLNYLSSASDATMLPASVFANHVGGTFKIGGQIPNTTASTGVQALVQTLVLEGYIDVVKLNQCDFRVCQPTAVSQGWSNLVNALLFQRPAVADVAAIPSKASTGGSFTVYNDYVDPTDAQGNGDNQSFMTAITNDMVTQFFTTGTTPATIQKWNVSFSQPANSSVFTFSLEARDAANALLGTETLSITLPPSVGISNVLAFQYSRVDDQTVNNPNKNFKAQILVSDVANNRRWVEVDASSNFDYCNCVVYGYNNLPSSQGK